MNNQPGMEQSPVVCDADDRIGLSDSLDQRLSKHSKRGVKSPAAELGIARKIFEMVDRKAAEPKTRPVAKKGVARVRQLLAKEPTLTPDERRILGSPHEILLIHSADGRLKSVTLGGPHEVTIPADAPADSILSHNHPSGRGPSASDLKSVLSTPGRTLRIVAVNESGKIEIFVLKATGTIPDHKISGAVEFYQQACELSGDTHQARRESLWLISETLAGILLVVDGIIQ